MSTYRHYGPPPDREDYYDGDSYARARGRGNVSPLHKLPLLFTVVFLFIPPLFHYYSQPPPHTAQNPSLPVLTLLQPPLQLHLPLPPYPHTPK